MGKRNGGLIGVQTARLWIYKEDGTIDTSFGENGIYTVSTDDDGGVTKASMSGLAPAQKEIYGNNTIVDISTGQAKPSIDFETNFLDHEILARVLGRKKIEDGSYTIEGDPNQIVGLEIISSDVAGHDVLFGFYKGHMVAGNIGLQTNNDNENRVNDAMTYKPVSNSNGHFGKIGYVKDETFDIDKFNEDLHPGAGKTMPSKP